MTTVLLIQMLWNITVRESPFRLCQKRQFAGKLPISLLPGTSPLSWWKWSPDDDMPLGLDSGRTFYGRCGLWGLFTLFPQRAQGNIVVYFLNVDFLWQGVRNVESLSLKNFMLKMCVQHWKSEHAGHFQRMPFNNEI